MKLLINISEYNAEYIKNTYGIPQDINVVIAEAIISGKQIPTPHGRLGDLDALIEEYGEWYTEEGTESGYIGTMKNLLKDAPTVIEAEGET